MTSRNEYLTALQAAQHLINPTTEQVLSVCPHLTEVQAIEQVFGVSGIGFMALPPLRIRHSYMAALYHHTQKGDFIFEAGAYNCRTQESFKDDIPHGGNFSKYAYMQQAMAYAEENWGGELVIDGWIDYQRINLIDPTRRNSYGTPSTTLSIHIGLARSWNEISNDRSKPRTSTWDEAITIATLEPLIGKEIRGGRGGYTQENCIRCGGKVFEGHCVECEIIEDYRPRWAEEFPQKVLELLREAGHGLT